MPGQPLEEPSHGGLYTAVDEDGIIVKKARHEPLTLLTLGDGDFSWSVDLAHHLASSPWSSPTKLIATGVDTEKELHDKYRNATCWLRELQQHATKAQHLSVEVHHQVDAVDSSSTTTLSADLVFFHHPHLGTEDAKRHASFLCHLFYAARETWLRHLSNGHLYLTLAAGQWERWSCARAAERHGFVLHERFHFHGTALGTNARYEHRRHQTGKSFRARTAGSITFHYVHGTNQRHREPPLQLPWFQAIVANESRNCEASLVVAPSDPFPCPHCDRSFQMERWLHQHVQAKHSDDSAPSSTSFPCESCDRTFLSRTGLEDHRRAKHTGRHTTNAALLQPEWSAAARIQQELSPAVVSSAQQKTCAICDAPQHDGRWLLPHEPPRPSLLLFACTYCRRSFSSSRAQHQHENFCPLLRDTGTNQAACTTPT